MKIQNRFIGIDTCFVSQISEVPSDYTKFLSVIRKSKSFVIVPFAVVEEAVCGTKGRERAAFLKELIESLQESIVILPPCQNLIEQEFISDTKKHKSITSEVHYKLSNFCDENKTQIEENVKKRKEDATAFFNQTNQQILERYGTTEAWHELLNKHIHLLKSPSINRLDNGSKEQQFIVGWLLERQNRQHGTSLTLNDIISSPNHRITRLWIGFWFTFIFANSIPKDFQEDPEIFNLTPKFGDLFDCDIASSASYCDYFLTFDTNLRNKLHLLGTGQFTKCKAMRRGTLYKKLLR